MKRYSLVVPDQMYEAVAEEAKRRSMTFVQVIRQALKIWLLIATNEMETTINIAGKPHKLIL